MSASAAFQDQIPDNRCFGCGPENDRGLQLKSYWEDDVAVSTFVPSPHHMAGPPHILNGGIIATIIDCHSICTAIAHAYRMENRPLGSAPLIWCATASLKVTYLRPAPIDAPVTLRARIVSASARKAVVSCSVTSGNEPCAESEVVAVRVSESWRDPGSQS